MENHENKMINEQMSNERTFLSWIRTGIGIMVFGFVIVKFSLFVNQLPSTFFQQSDIPKNGFTIVIGIALVLTGALTIIMSYLNTGRPTSCSSRENICTPLYCSLCSH